jgi:sugar O-acyltransferase (sialic acid O-acetyltransferase NeuD family)
MKVLFGASGHGKIAGAILRQLNEPFIFLDENTALPSLFFDTKVIIGYKNLKEQQAEILISIGNNTTRQKVAHEITHNFFTLLSPNAFIDDTVSIGEGSLVCNHSTIQVDSKIGKHVIINTGASIDHDCTISDFVHIAPQATLCGSITVGKKTFIGANTTVLPNLTIGENVTIGAGSVVTKDIPDNSIYLGNPAKPYHGK